MQIPELSPATQRDIPICISRALHEDIGSGDITAMLIPKGALARAQIIAREPAVLCGQAWADEVFKQLDHRICLQWNADEGSQVTAGQILATLTGDARGLLSGERTALNFLQTLSATATCARRYAQSASGSGLRVLDTRKTIPGLRLAQKYAVAVGGCENHRIGLFDAFLIKENHIAACGGIQSAIRTARAISADKRIEIEVENIAELQLALSAGADAIMLDNFSAADIRALSEIDVAGTEIEVSGNLTETDLEKYQNTGIDFVSSGSLTKHIAAIDLSMRIIDSTS